MCLCVLLCVYGVHTSVCIVYVEGGVTTTGVPTGLSFVSHSQTTYDSLPTLLTYVVIHFTYEDERPVRDSKLVAVPSS